MCHFDPGLSAHGNLGSCWSEEDGTKFFSQKINEEKRTEISVSKINGVIENLKVFCDCIRNSKTPETSGSEGAKVVLEPSVCLASRCLQVHMLEVRCYE